MLQVNAGLSHMAGVPVGFVTQVVLIAVITAMATLPVASGLDRGIRLLSNANLIMAGLLMAFVFVVGPTTFLLRAFVQNLGGYIDQFALRTFNMYAYDPKDWLGDWTLFYWGWWIAWSLFVGMFIARISRGRTIRQFVLGMLLVPGFTFAWMTVFGDSALHLSGVTEAVSQAVQQDVTLSLFVFLEQFPLSLVSSWFAMLLIVTFFVTSADSAALVVSTLAAGGRENVPVSQRIFWAVSSGVIAAMLLATGGLQAPQTAAIVSALPFAAMMLLICYGLWRGLAREGPRHSAFAQNLPPRLARSWQRQLHGILSYPRRDEVHAFLRDVAAPALEAVAGELRGRGLQAELRQREGGLRLISMPGAPEEFHYSLRLREYALPSFSYFEAAAEAQQREHYCRAEVFLEDGNQDYGVMGLAREELIQDVPGQYGRHFQFLHAVRAR